MNNAALWDKLLSRSIPEPNSGCLLWLGAICSGGYGWMGLPGTGKTIAVHRLSFTIHKGPIPNGLHVCHKCDVRTCVEPTHLWAGTNADNMADRNAKARARGGSRPGSQHYSTTLTEADVLAIRASTDTQRALAKRYGLHFGSINDIVRGRTWRHLQ